MKVSSHHVRSPMLDVNRSCQTCHRQDESELLARVAVIQDRTFQTRGVALDGLLDLVTDIEAALRIDSTHQAIATARDRQRQAQFLVDFVEAENSMGFHAPQEAMRLLALSINHSREGQKALRAVLRR
jgi:nitrite reductase (cytochrome c-552)